MSFGFTHRRAALPWLVLGFLIFMSGCVSDRAGPPPEPDGAGVPVGGDVTIVNAPAGATNAAGTPPTASDGTTPDPPTSALSSPAETPVSTTSTTIPDDAIWSLPAHLVDDVLELMAVVESLRGRAFLARPPVETATAIEGAAAPNLVSGWFSPEYLERQLALLDFLGMSSGEVDVEVTLDTAVSTPLAPFYDFGRRTIVLPSAAEPLDEYQKWVLVGELVHALTLQHDPAVVESLALLENHPDGRAALAALVEGEAALVQSLYLDSLPPERRSEVARRARSSTSLDALPAMLRDLILFPFREGALLMVDIYRLGGRDALDQALEHPPATTEHILHLDTYRRFEPAVAVQPVDVIADGYVRVEQGTWGEHRWRALLDHYSGPVEAARAAEGWGGDHYQLHAHPIVEDLVFVARYVGDSFADEAEMNSAIRTMLSSGIGTGPSKVVDTTTEWEGGTGYALLSWDIDAITLVVASDPAVGRAIASQLEMAE